MKDIHAKKIYFPITTVLCIYYLYDNQYWYEYEYVQCPRTSKYMTSSIILTILCMLLHGELTY